MEDWSTPKAPAAPVADTDWSTPKEDWSTPKDDAPVVNEQRVGDPERTILNNLGLGPESQVKWLQARGYEAGLDDEGVKVRRKGEKDFGRIEPQGFLAGRGLWGKGKELFRDLTQDAGDEWASGVGTVKGAALGALGGGAVGTAVPVVGNVVGGIAGGIAGAGLGAATVEAARRLAGKAAGFEESGGDFARGVGEQGLYGAAAQGGGQAIGKLAKGARNLLRGPKVEGLKEAAEAAPGILKAAEAPAAKAGIEGVEDAAKAAPGILEAGGRAAPMEAAEGLTPAQLDAILKPGAQAGVRLQPGAATTPPGLEPGWTKGHKAGGETARGIQEVGRHTPPRVFEGNYGPVTLVQGSRDQVKRLLDEAGDEGASFLYVKNPDPKALAADPGASSELRYFHNARPAARGPEAFPGEGATSFAENLKGWSDEDVLKLLHQRKAKIKGKMQPDFYGTTDINRLSREQMEDLLFRSQPNVVQGPRALKRNKKTGEVHYGAKQAKGGGDFDYQGNRIGHGLEGIWEKTGDDLDVGHYRSIHFDKILEMRIGKKVYRFSEEGKPVLAGTTDELPLPTSAVVPIKPGAPPELIHMTPKTIEKAQKAAMGEKLKAPAGATPQELAKRGIMPPGILGKGAAAIDKGLELPGKWTGQAAEKLGLDKETTSALKGVVGLGGLATVRIPAKLISAAAKWLDRLAQPGGFTRALASAPAAIRPTLQGIARTLQKYGSEVGKAAMYQALRESAPLREWISDQTADRE